MSRVHEGNSVRPRAKRSSHPRSAIELGMPSSVILLRMLQAVRTSLRCASSFRALNRPPKHFLYR